MASSRVPSVLWAQKSSETTKKDNFIFLTVIVPGIILSTMNYTVTGTTIALNVEAKVEDEQCRYSFELDFYAEVNPDATEVEVSTAESVNFVIYKKDNVVTHWTQLSLISLDYVEPAVCREISEEEQADVIGLHYRIKLTRSDWLLRLGTAFLSRYEQRRDLIDIECTVCHFQQAVQLTPSDHIDLPIRLTSLSNALRFRFERTGKLANIESAIIHLEKAVQLMPDGHSHLPVSLTSLGSCYTCRFERLGNLEDIGSSISNHQRVLKLTPAGHPSLPSVLNNLGISFARRFGFTENLSDIDSAISHQQQAVQLIPAGHTLLVHFLNNLGNSLRFRYERTEDLADIESAISHQERAIQLTPVGHDDLSSLLNNLAGSYLCRYERAGDLADIESAIRHQHQAVQLTPMDHAGLAPRLINLGDFLRCRFERTGDLADIESALSHLKKAVQLTPTGHSQLPSFLTSLGNCHACRFERYGDLSDINAAISNQEKAVWLTPAGHAELASRVNTLGNSFTRRFEHTGDSADIDSAISHQQQAVQLIPSDHYYLPYILNNLGSCYLCRFEQSGNLVDIDTSISYGQQAVQLTSEDHPDLPSRLNNLGGSYLARFQRMEDLADLDSGIIHQKRAVDLIPVGHTELPLYLNNLGNSYMDRFKHTTDLTDADSAISHQQEAVESTPAGHADLPSFLDNLGGSYLYRFIESGNIVDLEWAVSHRQQALQLTPAGHAALPSRLDHLGGCYLHRFKHTKNLSDVDIAISHQQQSVQLTLPGHTSLPFSLSNLGLSFSYRFEETGDSADIDCAITYYRSGAEAPGTPSKRLQCAKQAAILSQKLNTVLSIPDFSLSINLLTEVAGLEQTIQRRHYNIFKHSGFVSHAVATALEIGNIDCALEWLEQGRCLVWNQIDQLRIPVHRLREENPPLADKFTDIANKLEFLGTRGTDSANQSSYTNLDDAIRLQVETLLHTRTAADYKHIVDEIRRISGFEDFLRPIKTVSILSSVPVNGAVILFNIHTSRCDALALIKGASSPIHIPLSDFNHQLALSLQETLESEIHNHRTGRDQVRGAVNDSDSSVLLVLEVLWYKVVKPVLDALAYTQVQAQRTDRPRIWWCPSGPLSFLPLHAAGIYNSRTQQCVAVSDYVISSYTPTARSIKERLSQTASVSGNKSSLLLVSQPNTPGLPPIPSTREETHELKNMMETYGLNPLLLEDGDATRDKVREELNSHTWAHFACHGVQDPSQPLDSGLCLHDGRLKLLETMKQHINNPGVAFLSACQTGTGDSKLSEVVHLAAGMLAAGYHGVIGTMWSISDEHGPRFAREFYQYLLNRIGENGLDTTLAAYALNHATTEVRKLLGSNDGAFLTWVPYVHFGY